MEGLKSGWGIGPTPMVLKGLKPDSLTGFVSLFFVTNSINYVDLLRSHTPLPLTSLISVTSLYYLGTMSTSGTDLFHIKSITIYSFEFKFLFLPGFIIACSKIYLLIWINETSQSP